MKTPIHDFLSEYAGKNKLRCHMPGNKGVRYPFDITEIDGADVLYESGGIILESEKNTAGLFGAKHTCYSCGGSTLCIQAMLYAALSRTGKKRIAAGRYSHKSFINTAVLLGFETDWLYPDSFLSAGISPGELRRVITDDTAAVFVTAIDYYGGQADIAALSEVCREKNIPLLADNAHGAYKVFTGDHPLALGADMTADSAHKTLPALTGAAYLHINDSRYYESAKRGMSLFGSSSPSYLMLDSLDLCCRFIAEEKNTALESIKKISLLKKQLVSEGFILKNSDDMRITVNACAAGYTGYELAEILREHGLECEMSDYIYVVLLFSVSQPEGDAEKIYKIFNSITKKAPIPTPEIDVIKNEIIMPPREAYFSESREMKTEEAVGKICSGIYCPCPPCVPLVMPGERISEKAAQHLLSFGVNKIRTVF